MPAEVAGCLGKLAVVKVVMLSTQPVVLDKAVAKGRPIVVSKVVELLEKVRAKIVPVGSPKAEDRGDPCRVARWLPRVVKHVECRRNVVEAWAVTLSRPDKAVAKDKRVVVSKVAVLLGKVNAEMVPVGSPKAEAMGDPCRGARWHPRVVRAVDRRRDVVVAKGRPVVASKDAALLENLNVEMVPVGSPKVEATGDPCRVAR